MPRKPSAHSELDQLRQATVQERMRVRDLEVELEQAKLEVERASDAITAGYAEEDERAVAKARKLEQQAVEKVKDTQHRLSGAQLRVERAQQTVDGFASENAERLLSEAEDGARKTTADLTRSASETVRLFRQYKSDRTRIQELVNLIEPGAGQVNGPPTACVLEGELHDLERGLRQHDELEPPLPRWGGRIYRQQADQVHRRLHAQRGELSAKPRTARGRRSR